MQPLISTETTTPAVSVVVVTYNSERVLPEFLSSLPAGMEGVGDHELVVVDNASTDATLDVVARQAPDAVVVALPHNRGFAAGVNAGVAVARSQGAVLILNPDIRLRGGAVAALMRALTTRGAGIAVPRMVDRAGHLDHSLRREPTVLRALAAALIGGRHAARFRLLGEVVGDPDRYSRPGTADWATGAAFLVSRRCLDEVGPWDESFFLYSEETDFALRARDAGFGLRYAPDAEVVHLGGDVTISPRLWTMLTLNRIRLYRRRHGRARAAMFVAAVALNEALRAAAGSPTHRAALAALVLRSRRPPELDGASR